MGSGHPEIIAKASLKVTRLVFSCCFIINHCVLGFGGVQMRKVLLVALAASLFVSSAQAQSRAGDRYFGSVPSNAVTRDICRLTFDHRILVSDNVDDLCFIDSKPSGTMILSGIDGCSVRLTQAGGLVRAYVQAYRSSCQGDNDLSEDVGVVTRENGPCWSNRRIEICVSVTPEDEFEGYVD